MLELIVGAVIGAVFSIVIAEIYHRRASKETQVEIDRLKKLSESLQESLDEITNVSFYTSEMTETVRKHVTAGTIDDPDYPYK